MQFAMRDVEARKVRSVEGFYILKSLAVRQSKAGKEYLDITVSDATGASSGKVWDVDPTMKDLTPGNIIKIRATVEEYMGQTQLNFSRIRARQAGDEEVDYSLLIPCAPEDPQAMYDFAWSFIEGITNEDIKKLVSEMWDDRKDQLLSHPAALTFHHSVRSGLLQHITSMLRGAKALLEVYDFLNADVLYAGVLLHDICKVEELQTGDLGIATQYSVEGQLLGHITLGAMAIGKKGAELGTPQDIINLLAHMVLSHHELPEYGSPKPPMTPEAEVLQTLDKLDARLYDLQQALQNVAPGGFSDPIASLGRRKAYQSQT